MGAFEETKCRRSIVSDTLQGLTEQARRWREKIDLLEAGQRLDREETVAELGRLLDACQNLRDAILSEDSGATWKTKTELQALVVRLDQVAEKRNRYLDLAQLLSAGTVSHRRERTKQERLRQRDAAVAELMEISAMIAPPDLPGPAAEEWLNWACSLDDSTNDPDLAQLKAHFPRVDDFVRQLEIEMWQDGPVSNPDHMPDHVVEAVPQYKADSRWSFRRVFDAHDFRSSLFDGKRDCARGSGNEHRRRGAGSGAGVHRRRGAPDRRNRTPGTAGDARSSGNR